MVNIGDIASKLGDLTISELKMLIDELSLRYNIPLDTLFSSGSSSSNIVSESVEKKDKDDYTVKLVSVGPDKIKVIRLVQILLQCKDLIESKNIIDSAPCVLLEHVSNKTAIDIKSQLESIGATIELT